MTSSHSLHSIIRRDRALEHLSSESGTLIKENAKENLSRKGISAFGMDIMMTYTKQKVSFEDTKIRIRILTRSELLVLQEGRLLCSKNYKFAGLDSGMHMTW
jgi:hypothetical protein